MAGIERYKKVYEWNLAYRIDHWVRTVAMFVLIFTGYYIYWPFIKGSEGTHVMNWMRFLHFVAMYILILGLVVRIYFDKTVIPNISDIPDILAYYLLLKDTHKEYDKYNPLQALTYIAWGILIIIQTLTGFALYSGKAFGVWNSHAAFGWVNSILGGAPITRTVHFSIMWIFIITVGIHVYMGILKDLTDRDNTFLSMFTGYKIKRVK